MIIQYLNFNEEWSTDGKVHIQHCHNGYRITKYFGKHRDYSYTYRLKLYDNLKDLNKNIKEAIKTINEYAKENKLVHGLNYIIN